MSSQKTGDIEGKPEDRREDESGAVSWGTTKPSWVPRASPWEARGTTQGVQKECPDGRGGRHGP